MAKNLASGEAGFIGSHVISILISNDEIFSNQLKIIDCPHQTAHGFVKIGGSRRIYLNADKAKKDLGWSPMISLEDGLRENIECFKASKRAI